MIEVVLHFIFKKKEEGVAGIEKYLSLHPRLRKENSNDVGWF